MNEEAFVYGVDEAPQWFSSFKDKCEVNFNGFATCFIYSTDGECRRRYSVGETIERSGLWG